MTPSWSLIVVPQTFCECIKLTKCKFNDVISQVMKCHGSMSKLPDNLEHYPCMCAIKHGLQLLLWAAVCFPRQQGNEIAGMEEKMIYENKEKKLMQKLTKAPVAEHMSRTKRFVFLWTCSQIRQLPILFSTVSVLEIAAINNTEFEACLPVIGAKENLSPVQKSAFLEKAVKVFGNNSFCRIPLEKITELGSIITAISFSDIQCLPLNDVSYLTTIGRIVDWSKAQLAELAKQYMSHQLDRSLAVLGSILCGFTPEQIALIPPVEIWRNGRYLGQLSVCSTEVLQALKKLAVERDAFGPVDKWTESDVTELGYIIAGLDASDVPLLTLRAFNGLNPEVIPHIPVEVFKRLNIVQLSSLTDRQMRAVTKDQFVSLSDPQQKVIRQRLGSTFMASRMKEAVTSSTGSLRLSVVWLFYMLFCILLH